MPLPPLDPNCSVSSRDGREDRIRMSLGCWYVGIKAKEWHQRLDAVKALRGALMEGNIFSRASVNHVKEPIPIRAGKGGQGDDESEPFEYGDNLPLFAGELETTLFHKLDDAAPAELFGNGFSGYIRLQFPRFFLNPLRFVRHQPLPVGPQWAKAKWFKNSTSPNTGGEFSFTNDDNWLPAATEWDAFASSEKWQRHLKRYVNRVTERIRDELEQAIELAEDQNIDQDFEFGALVERPDYKVRELETCWEFADSDPCEKVRFLKQNLSDLGRGEVTATVYKVQLNMMRHKGTETKEFNSIGIRFKLLTGMELRVYAKTNKRIRFEIIQHNPPRAKLLNAANFSFVSDEKSYSEIPVLLKQARRTAAEILNETVFPSIASEPDLRIRQRSVMGFLADFAKACEDAQSLRTVISLLISNRFIQVGVPGKPVPEKLATIIQKLKRKPKLLVWSKAHNAYGVASRYRWALEKLQQADEKMIETLLGSAPPRER